jgi:hypothetical protein
MQIAIYVHLAREAKLAEHAILLERVVLSFAHFRLVAVNRDAARGAASMTAATVTDVNAVSFNCVDKLRTFGNCECGSIPYADLKFHPFESTCWAVGSFHKVNPRRD